MKQQFLRNWFDGSVIACGAGTPTHPHPHSSATSPTSPWGPCPWGGRTGSQTMVLVALVSVGVAVLGFISILLVLPSVKCTLLPSSSGFFYIYINIYTHTPPHTLYSSCLCTFGQGERINLFKRQSQTCEGGLFFLLPPVLVLHPPKLWPVRFFEAGRGGFPVSEASERAYTVMLLLMPSPSGYGHQGWGRDTQWGAGPASPSIPSSTWGCCSKAHCLGQNPPVLNPLGSS